MKTYTAEFRTDVDFATRVFRARSPQDALQEGACLCGRASSMS